MVGFLLLLTGEASAHAELAETNPANGAHLDRAPAEVVLRFSEPVTLIHDGFAVLDGAGKSIARPAGTVDGSRVRLALPGSLGDGVYVINWRVVSADSHPVHGAFVFSVGTAQAAPLGDAGAQSGSDSLVGVAFWLFRLLGYISLAVLIGGSFFLVACWPAGRPDPRVHRLIRTAWIAAVGSAVAALLIQGPYAAGTGLLTMADPALLLDTLRTGYGVLLLVRVVLLALAGYILIRLVRSAGPGLAARQLAVFAVLGVALAATWSGAGHPAAAGSWAWAALPLDVAHLVAVAVWLGGLVVLAGWTLSRRSTAGDDEAASAVDRYSKAAAVAVAVLGATGLLQAWREIAASGVGTEYFTLLVFKVGAFGLLVWLAALSRAAVRGRRPAGGRTVAPRRGAARRAQQDMLTRLRASVRWEAVIAGVVLALTAVLVATPPGGHDHGPAAAADTAAGPFSRKVGMPGGDVQIWLDPAHTGTNQLVVNVRDPKGQNRDVPEVEAQLTMPANNVGPLSVPLKRTGPGQFVADALAVPVPGDWRLILRVRTTEFDQSTVETEVPVR